MRQYDDPVEVRRGDAEDPDQFLWRGRLWKVRAVLAHRNSVAGRELWRVEAGRGMHVVTRGRSDDPDAYGVFDLSLDRSDGRWQLVGCQD